MNWVLIHGEEETGVTLHYMEEKPDKGDIVAARRVPIAPADTALTLFARMTAAAGDLMREAYPLLRAGQAPRLPQDHGQASYFGGRGPADGLIDWQKSAWEVYNLVRAVTNPYPGAFTYLKGKKLFVWAGQPMKAPPAAGHAAYPPGRIIAALPGEGLLVAAAQGHFLIQRAQWEGEPEFLGPVLATWEHLVGERLG